MEATKWEIKLLKKMRKLYSSLFIETEKRDLKISMVTLNATREF
jgi:hypothetical protein